MSTPQPLPARPSAPAEDEIDLRAYAYTLHEARWLVAAVTFACAVLALAYAVLAEPTFRSDTLLQVEQKNAGLPGLEEMNSLLSGETPADTEIEILRSRSLVGGVVDELSLDVEVSPKRFPVIGWAIARAWHGEGARPAVLGMSSYGWGGAKARVERLQVPRGLENERLKLVAMGQGRYALYDPEGEKLLEGKVGEKASSASGSVALFVSELVANEGTQFRVVKRNRDEVVGRLQEELVIREKGKKTGILQVSLDGPNRERLASTLDALARAYLKQNVDRKSEEAEKTLEFLETQLPVLKHNLEQAETALNEYRAQKGTVDLSLETQKMLEREVEVAKGLTELEVQKAELKQLFTESHPRLAALRSQASQLKGEQEAIEAKLKTLPEAELKSARFMRDVKVADELYVLLLNKAQEMKVVKNGTVGNVRILDAAILPGKPVSPKKALSGLLGLFAGLGLGATIALVRKAMNQGVEDPNEIERQFGLSVYATVPHSESQQKAASALERGKAKGLPILAKAEPEDVSVESLRSLRTSLQFALMDSKNRVIAIGGPAPGIGKSFISVNLAQVLADAGKRVLLIDADMRKGKLHQYFGIERTGGLSEVVSGSLELEQAIRTPEVHGGIAFLPAGVVPPNPSELLLSERFRAVMDAAEKQFDLVIVDCAPVLAVTDGAIVGRLAGVNLMVLKAGQHPVREIEAAVKRYAQNGVKPNGAVINDLTLNASRYASGRYVYQYKY